MNKRFICIKSLLSALLLILLLIFGCSCDLNDLNNNHNEESTVSQPSGSFTAHYLDVGQGDSILLELPNSECMLIDSGENYHGKGIIDYITALGYSKIDYLVATHPHSDHIGSMAYIVRNFDIGEIYMPKVGTNTSTYESLLKAIQKKELKVHSAAAGMNIFDSQGLSIDIIAPVTIVENDLNNCSIVMKAVYGSTSFLFTGDAETKEFNTITADMSADVLKVGHHGSKTSTTEEVLSRVKPTTAVISCGKDNTYGHPHKSTIKYLNAIDCKIYRTDEDKTIIIKSDGRDLSVETGAKSIERDKQK